MKRVILFFLSVVALGMGTVSGQTVRMRDVFANLPDSIFPLITRNNRLDCIDFIENNMPAQVKNLVDEPIELLALTDDYLDLKMSGVSHAEMKLVRVSDSLSVICLVKTYAGPLRDSSIRFYDTQWKALPWVRAGVSDVEAFLTAVPEGEEERKRDVTAQLREQPFISAALHKDSALLTLTLQTGELMKKDREWLAPYCKPVEVDLTALLQSQERSTKQ